MHTYIRTCTGTYTCSCTVIYCVVNCTGHAAGGTGSQAASGRGLGMRLQVAGPGRARELICPQHKYHLMEFRNCRLAVWCWCP